MKQRLRAGTVIWAAANCDPQLIEDCRAWLRERGYTSDDVRIILKEGVLTAELKREIEFEVGKPAFWPVLTENGV